MLSCSTTFYSEEEIKLELKDDATSEELGYLLVKLRVESGTTHVADVKDQKSLKKQVCIVSRSQILFLHMVRIDWKL